MDEKQARCAACNARNAYVVDQAAFKRAGLGPITRAWPICSGTENGATTQSVAAEEPAYRASLVPGPAPRVTAALRIGRLAWSCHVSATERSRSSRGLSARALLSEPIGGRTLLRHCAGVRRGEPLGAFEPTAPPTAMYDGVLRGVLDRLSETTLAQVLAATEDARAEHRDDADVRWVWAVVATYAERRD